jgi:hypothetical protein
MVKKFDPNNIDASKFKGPARDFVLFCDAEKHRRENSAGEFDAELHDKAVELILRRLGVLDEENVP